MAKFSYNFALFYSLGLCVVRDEHLLLWILLFISGLSLRSFLYSIALIHCEVFLAVCSRNKIVADGIQQQQKDKKRNCGRFMLHESVSNECVALLRDNTHFESFIRARQFTPSNRLKYLHITKISLKSSERQRNTRNWGTARVNGKKKKNEEKTAMKIERMCAEAHMVNA